MEYLSDGISESIINTLSELPQLKVIARGSAFKYKGQEIDPESVARSLGVRAIVTGRVRQTGDNLQVGAELMDVYEKRHVWGELYIRKTEDIQAVQEEISRRISEKLRLRLTGAQEQKLSKRATAKPEAYQLYLNGVFYTRKEGVENFRKAFDYFNRAVSLDPNFALALAEVADAYRFFGVTGLLDPKEAYPKAKEAAWKAIDIDETLADAHLSLGIIKTDEWDWAGADYEFKRAIELNTNLAEAYFRYAQYLPMMGRSTEALAAIKRAQELDPLWTSMKAQEGACLFYARRYNEAAQQLQQYINLEGDLGFAHTILGYTYASKRMYPEAIVEYRKAISIDGETTSIQCFLGYALAQGGKRNEAQTILDKLKKTKEHVSLAELAVLYAGLGDKEGALISLERAYALRDPQMQFIKVDPHYDSLRTDSRFQNVIRMVGLAP
jgi:TolB-like protein/Flp pilus assembly protein TadD